MAQPGLLYWRAVAALEARSCPTLITKGINICKPLTRHWSTSRIRSMRHTAITGLDRSISTQRRLPPAPPPLVSPDVMSIAINQFWLDTFHVDGFRFDDVPEYWDGPMGSGDANLVYSTYQYESGDSRPLSAILRGTSIEFRSPNICLIPPISSSGATAPGRGRTKLSAPPKAVPLVPPAPLRATGAATRAEWISHVGHGERRHSAEDRSAIH